MIKIGLLTTLVVLWTIAGTNADQSLESAYNNELGKLAQFARTSEFRFLSEAARSYKTSYPPATKLVGAAEALAAALSKQAPGNKAQQVKAYNEQVGRPCKRVVELNTRFLKFLNERPKIDDWTHQIERLPVMWYKVANMCREQTRKGVLNVIR